MKTILKWLAISAVDILLALSLFWYVGAIFVALTSKPEVDTDRHTWGGWFGTYDNPPQGDSQWQTICPFPFITDGWRGYVNRVGWMWRNPGYNFQKQFGVKYSEHYILSDSNSDYISDKYGIAGTSLCKVYNLYGELVAFQLYIVHPYSFWKGKCFRAKLGYKVRTDKFKELGFAPVVNTINPFKSFGET